MEIAVTDEEVSVEEIRTGVVVVLVVELLLKETTAHNI